MEKIITLDRRYFIENTAGENELDWVLYQLGIPEEQRNNIQAVTLIVTGYETEEV